MSGPYHTEHAFTDGIFVHYVADSQVAAKVMRGVEGCTCAAQMDTPTLRKELV